MNMKKLFNWGLVSMILVVFSLNPELVKGQNNIMTGEAIKWTKNKRDIYHPKNEGLRKELINEAVMDAIERGGIREVKLTDVWNMSSTKEKSFEEVYEDYLSISLQKLNVEWRRTSNYVFTLIGNKNEKKWKCEVEGEIRNLTLSEDTTSDWGKSSTINNDIITKKNYNLIYINSGNEDSVTTGDKFIIYRQKRIKTVNGFHLVPKQVGYATIKNAHPKFSQARVLKGTYSVRESQLVKKADFKTTRFGLEYQLSSSYEQINSTEYGFKESSINTVSHSIFLSRYSYLSRTGFKFGVEFMDTEITKAERDTSTYIFIPKFNWYFSVGLVPDLLYLNPGFSVGYMFVNFTDKTHFFDDPNKKWGNEFVLEAGLNANLRIKFIDLYGGLSYKYINDYQELKNIYPYIGIMINFVRMVPKDFKID